MLSPRLEVLARQVPVGSKVADIGTDHGLIPVYLAKNNISTKIIATDISAGSLQKAKDLVKKENLEHIIETRLGSGLQAVTPGEVDTVMIAGMGGLLIGHILEEGSGVLKSVSKLILQPMHSSEPVRRLLVKQGFAVDHELLVKDGSFIYEVIVAQPGDQEVADDIQYEIGFKFMENKDPLFKKFIGTKIVRTKKIIKELEEQNTKNAKEAREIFQIKLGKYEEAYRWFVQ